MSDQALRERLEQVGRELEGATGRWTARRRRRRRVTALAVSVFVVASGSALVISDFGAQDVEVAAAEVLRRAASAVTPQPLRRGQYHYEKTISLSRLSVPANTRETNRPPRPGERTYTALVRQTAELWTARDGSGRIVEREAKRPRFPSRRDRSGWKRARSPRLPGSRPGVREETVSGGATGTPSARFRDAILGVHDLSARRVVRLSRNQRAFDRVVRSKVKSVVDPLTARESARRVLSASSADAAVFSFAAEMLARWGEPMPSRLQAAFYRLAAGLRGIETVPGARDLIGRRAVGVTLGGTTLLFDPNSYALLETRYRLDPSVQTTITRVEEGVVPSPRARP